MKHQKPDWAQPVPAPILPPALAGIPLRSPTETGSVDAFLELLVEIALSQLAQIPVVQSTHECPLKKAA